MTGLAALPAAPVARISDAERDAIRDYIVRTIHGEVSKAVEAIDLSVLRGKDGDPGEPGLDGKDAVLDVPSLVQEVVALVPVPKDGKDAEPIDRAALVNEVLALVPVPRDGKDGKDGESGPAGADGTNGKRGEKGIDGRDGRDGKDGIASLDDLRAEVAKAVEGSVGPTVEKQVAETFAALPILQYRGVFRDEATYKAGHCVTWAGAVWHANAVTQEKPGEGQTAWTLMVKRGDKGKDLR